MPQIHETIPRLLAAEVEAARSWFAREQGGEFKVTGIVEPDEAPVTGPRDLQLILCGESDGEEVCLRERFSVTPVSGGFDVKLVEDETPAVGSPAPLLDPPAGGREGWIDSVLARHSFVVLLFYRGFW